MAMLQLDPPLPVVVDLEFFPAKYRPTSGKGLCHVLIDSYEHDMQWVVALNAGGRVWCVPNPHVRLARNITMGRTLDPPAPRRRRA